MKLIFSLIIFISAWQHNDLMAFDAGHKKADSLLSNALSLYDRDKVASTVQANNACLLANKQGRFDISVRSLSLLSHSYKRENKAKKKIKILMQELHHRVKNNLQILFGLFTLQINELKDGATKEALRENEARLASMNLIHSRLYMENSDNSIEMQEYLNKLM